MDRKRIHTNILRWTYIVLAILTYFVLPPRQMFDTPMWESRLWMTLCVALVATGVVSLGYRIFGVLPWYRGFIESLNLVVVGISVVLWWWIVAWYRDSELPFGLFLERLIPLVLMFAVPSRGFDEMVLFPYEKWSDGTPLRKEGLGQT